MSNEDKPAKSTGAGSSGAGAPHPPIETKVIRSRLIELPPEFVQPERLQRGDRLTLPLFDGIVYRLEVKDLTRHVQGSLTFTAEVLEPYAGYLIAAHSDGRSLITVDLPGESTHYRITYDAEAGAYRLEELALETVPDGLPDILIPPAEDEK
jgi:hypothetical protein